MFQNREEAGMLLAKKLLAFKRSPETIVLAIPRGGVAVGEKIAEKLSLPLSVVVVKKLGAPGNPELAIGAVAPSGIEYIDWEIARQSGVGKEYLNREIEEKRKEIEQREKKFRVKNLESRIRKKKTIILVDDGIATGATTRAAIEYLKGQKIILAVPVIAQETYNKLQSEVEKIIVLEIPQFFEAVGQFYRDFPQVSDEQVVELLK